MEKQFTTITLSSKIDNILEIQNELSEYCKLNSFLERKLFNYINNNIDYKLDYNLLQKQYIKEYNIHARLFKSLWKNTLGKLQAINSNNKNYIENDKIRLEKLTKELKSKKKTKFQKHFIKQNINKLNQKLNNNRKISRMWGSKSFYKKQWNCEDKEKWLEQWKIKRNHSLFIIGSSDESFGNSLCQLQTLNNIRLTLPKNFQNKYINLSVDFNKDKKIYKYLQNAVIEKKALTYTIYQNSDNKNWYVSISFSISNECLDHNYGTIGLDFNYNLIALSSIKQDGNKEYFKNLYFELDKNNSNKNTQILSDLVSQIVNIAKENRKTITIEKLDLKKILKDEKLSYVVYNKFFSLLKVKCVKEGILIIEVNPAFTSIIGSLKYQRRFGVSRHASASYVIGRRGLNYIERIPKKYICLLQSGEKDKSMFFQWKSINKRLNKVSKFEKSLYLFGIYKDQSLFNLNS